MTKLQHVVQTKIHYIQLQIVFVKQIAEKRAFWAPQPFDIFHISTFIMKSVVPQTSIPFFPNACKWSLAIYSHGNTQHRTCFNAKPAQNGILFPFFFKCKQSSTIQLQARPTNTRFIVTNCCQDAFRYLDEFQLHFTCLGKKGYYTQQ